MGRENCLNPTIKKIGYILIAITIIIIFFMISDYCFFIKMDTFYANKFCEVMSGYNIDEIDEYFGNNVCFSNGNVDLSYNDVRKNIIQSLEEKHVQFNKYSAEGFFENANFFNRRNIISIVAYIPNDMTYSEMLFKIQVKHAGYRKYIIEKCYAENNILFDYCLTTSPLNC